MASRTGRGGGSVQPLKEIEAAVIGDIVPVEAIEVGLIGLLTGGGITYNYRVFSVLFLEIALLYIPVFRISHGPQCLKLVLAILRLHWIILITYVLYVHLYVYIHNKYVHTQLGIQNGL